MKIKAALALLLTGLLCNTAFAGIIQPSGERLIAFTPDPDIWEGHNKDIIESKSIVWFKKDMRAKGKPFDDFYMINIYNESENSLENIRDRNDMPGRKFCDAFESVDIEGAADSVYRSLFWRTLCLKASDPQARLIHLVIKGDRHIYHIQKGWRGEADPADVEKWIQRIGDIYVCDANREDAACPLQETLAQEKTKTETGAAVVTPKESKPE